MKASRLGMVAVGSLSGLLGWWAASGRLAETFGQDGKSQRAPADGKQLPKPEPEFKGIVAKTFADSYMDFAFTGKIDRVTIELK